MKFELSVKVMLVVLAIMFIGGAVVGYKLWGTFHPTDNVGVIAPGDSVVVAPHVWIAKSIFEKVATQLHLKTAEYDSLRELLELRKAENAETAKRYKNLMRSIDSVWKVNRVTEQEAQGLREALEENIANNAEPTDDVTLFGADTTIEKETQVTLILNGKDTVRTKGTSSLQVSSLFYGYPFNRLQTEVSRLSLSFGVDVPRETRGYGLWLGEKMLYQGDNLGVGLNLFVDQYWIGINSKYKEKPEFEAGGNFINIIKLIFH